VDPLNRREALRLGLAVLGGMTLASVQAVRAQVQKIILGPGESVIVEAEALSPSPSPSASHDHSPSQEPPPSPSAGPEPGVDRVMTGDQPDGFSVPAGQVWRIEGLVTSPKNVIVNGTLRMRAGDTLRFRNVNEALFVGGGMEPVASDVGLWLRPGGTLDAQGTPKSGWHRVDGALLAGQRGIVLDADPVGWNAGDEVAIAPTLPPTDVNYLQVEVRTIAAISGRSITLDSGLSYDHPAVEVKPGKVMTAEVVNLTRDCVIEGTSTGRTHVHAMPSSPQTIKHALFRHMGPQKPGADGKMRGVRGRYPLHFHEVEDATRDSLVEGCVVRDSGFHGFVPHTSHGITFRDCVAFDCLQAPYWWDVDDALGDDAESKITKDTVWEHCAAIRTGLRVGRDGGFVLQAGTTKTTGPATNTMRDCVNAASYQRGDSVSSTEHSGIFWNNGIWIFEDNVTHNGAGFGAGLWWNPDTQDIADRFVVYHHKGTMLAGAYSNPYLWRDCIFYGCQGPIEIHGFGKNALPLRFLRCHFDMAGLTDRVFQLINNSKVVQAPMIVEDSVLTGYTSRALTAPASGKNFKVEFHNTVFSGNEMILNSNLTDKVSIRVKDSSRDLLAKQKDQLGTSVSEWNASVTGTGTL
jgi:hypothetical protein